MAEARKQLLISAADAPRLPIRSDEHGMRELQLPCADEEARAKEQAEAAKAARLAGLKRFTPEERAAADAVTKQEMVLAEARRRAQQRLEGLEIWSWSDNDVPRTIQLYREEMTRDMYAKMFKEEKAKVEMEATSNGAATAGEAAAGTKRGRDEDDDESAKRARS